MTDLRVEKGRATRDRLLAAGRQVFGERGYEGASIEAILEQAGVARGALYHHFATKEALFEAVLDMFVAELATIAADAARAGSDPVESLRAGCQSWLRMALHPAVQRIALLDPPAVLGWTRWREVDERYMLGGLRVNLERLADEGRLPADDVDALAHMVHAAVNEAALFVARGPDPEAAFAQGSSAVELLITRLVGQAQPGVASTRQDRLE
jgi:AcrR family transcriptional regulator